MNWSQLTVEQAQKIDKIRTSVQPDDIVADVNTRLLSVITGKTEDEIDSLKLIEYRDLCKQLSFLETEIGGQPVKYIKANGKRYRCIYKVEQMPFARYIEGKTFANDFMGNIHKLAASMVMPQRRNWYGRWVDKRYNAADHVVYATDLLQAPFANIYHSCLFFYHVYRNWIEVSKDYLISEIVKTGKSQQEAEKQVSDLCATLDGSIHVKLLPNLKV